MATTMTGQGVRIKTEVKAPIHLWLQCRGPAQLAA